VPPLEPETPCETQEPPNLASSVGAPPPVRKINLNSKAVKERSAKARAVAIELERRRLKADGSKLKVLDRDATMRDVTAIARKLGLERQLQRLTAKVKAGGR
jgi:phospholipid/cholesterol/gamma-HCH transport system substrate-binding protein